MFLIANRRGIVAKRRGVSAQLGLVVVSLVFYPASHAQQSQANIAVQAEVAQAQPVRITFDEAVKRAEANEPAYAVSMGDAESAALDRTMARTALLPSVVYHNQALYTQSN